MTAVFKREFKSYFHSVLGYVYIAFVLFIIGIYFSYYNLQNGYPYFGEVLGSLSFIFLVAVPLLTMRSLSEERKSRTDQLLFTAPEKITGIIMGKYLAAISVYAIPVLFSCLYPLVISWFGSAYFLVDYSCILAFFLMGCAYVAIGLYVSSLTESMVLAAIGTFAILLVLYLMNSITGFIPETAIASMIGFVILAFIVAALYHFMTKNVLVAILAGTAGTAAIIAAYVVNSEMFAGALPAFLNKLSLQNYFENFIYNTFDLTAIIYYLSIGFIFVFLTIQSIQKRRYS